MGYIETSALITKGDANPQNRVYGPHPSPAPHKPSVIFKVANSTREFEQIHRLNYLTFVKEIPQHAPNDQEKLIDPFHEQNTYIIALRNDEVIAMVAIRGERPFSLDRKLPNLDSLLPIGPTTCEVRLLAIAQTHRGGRMLLGLLGALVGEARRQGYDRALISGTTRQLKLYESMGFVPFGPMVGTPQAAFQPMVLTLEDFRRSVTFLPGNSKGAVQTPAEGESAIFTPGPVNIGVKVRQAFQNGLLSHRSPAFAADFEILRQRLQQLVSASHVSILSGSGTLANDALAAQLSASQTEGAILSNGEFGERLLDHCRRWGLRFRELRAPWGTAFSRQAIENAVETLPPGSWLWTTHCETSTGVLNDIDTLKAICRERQLRLCLDCISSIGTLPVDLRDVFFASAVSGKGLGSYCGVSMLFHDHEPAPMDRLPRYLDLAFYQHNGGIPFTVSSNLIYALSAALDRFESPNTYQQLAALTRATRVRLRNIGFQTIAPEQHASPAVITLAPPKSLNSHRLCQQLKREGFYLNFESSYLRSRNWFQICLMGELPHAALEALLKRLEAFVPS